MKRAVLAIAGLAALLPWLAAADDPTEPSSPAPLPEARDVQDVVFLADSRPVLLRLHVRINGKPFRDAWDEVITRLFHFLDRDGNGVLSQAEIDHAPKAQLVLQLLRGNYFDPTTRSRPSEALGVDFVADKVTRQGLATYYRQSGVEPFLVFSRDRSARAGPLTDALYRHLDRNKDGKLSKDEVQAATKSLRKLDLNDDEVIDREEVLPTAQGDDPNRPARRERTELLSEESAFFVPSADDPPNRLGYALLNRYDKEQNQKLSRTAIGLDTAVFDLLDRDHDGELSVRELARFRECPPDIELVVEFGGSAGDNGLVYLHNPNGPLVATTERVENGALVLRIGKVQLDLGVGGGGPAGFESTRQLLLDQFASADVTKRGYLDKVQIQQNPFLVALFPAAEGSDIKLTAKELAAELDLLGQAVATCTVLLITEHGQALFELLNIYHDGRLRQHELKMAWTRLAPWDLKGGGFITRGDLPRQVDLLLTQGQPGNPFPNGDGMPVPVAAGDRRPTAPARGPLWFRKMDQNGDGVVSLREFLGSREDFKRIDTNGDGLITAEEAERADAAMRKQKAKAAPQPGK